MKYMTMGEAVSYKEDPNYQAFLAQDVPPWQEAWSATRPEAPAPQHLTPEQQREIVEANLDLIGAGVRHLEINGQLPPDREEAALSAAAGLCDAARLFDLGWGVKFRTYAPHRVRGETIDNARRYDGLGGKDRDEPQVVSQLNGTRARSLFEPVFTLSHGGVVTLEETIPADQPSTEEVAHQNNDALMLHEMIGLLGDRQRQAILLKLQCLSHKAIAASLGVSVSTVGRDLREARTTLRELLQPHICDPDGTRL